MFLECNSDPFPYSNNTPVLKFVHLHQNFDNDDDFVLDASFQEL